MYVERKMRIEWFVGRGRSVKEGVGALVSCCAVTLADLSKEGSFIGQFHFFKIGKGDGSHFWVAWLLRGFSVVVV